MVDKLDCMHKFLFTMQERSLSIRELVQKKRFHDQEMIRKMGSDHYYLDHAEHILDILGRDRSLKKALGPRNEQNLRLVTSEYSKALRSVNHRVSRMKGKDFDRLEGMGIPALKMRVELSHSSHELAKKAEELHKLTVSMSNHLQSGKIKAYLEDIKEEQAIENRVVGHFKHLTDSLGRYENKMRKVLMDSRNSLFFPYSTTVKVAALSSVVGAYMMGFMQDSTAVPGKGSINLDGVRSHLRTSWNAYEEHDFRQMMNELL